MADKIGVDAPAACSTQSPCQRRLRSERRPRPTRGSFVVCCGELPEDTDPPCIRVLSVLRLDVLDVPLRPRDIEADMQRVPPVSERVVRIVEEARRSLGQNGSAT